MRVSIELGFSIQNVSLIEINAVPAKQLAVFLLKGASAMVLLLPPDILHHGIELTRTYRQGAPYPRCAILRDSRIRQVMCGIRRPTLQPVRGPRLSLSQRERMKVRDCFSVAARVRTRLLATRCRALGEPDDSRIATQRLHGQPGILTAFYREFGLHSS